MAYNFVDRNDKTKPDELSDEYLEVDDPYLYSILRYCFIIKNKKQKHTHTQKHRTEGLNGVP